MHFPGIQLILMCLQLSHTFHALKDFFLSVVLTGSYKCMPEFRQLHAFRCRLPGFSPLCAAGYCVLQSSKPGRWNVARKHLSETVGILHKLICLYSTRRCLMNINHSCYNEAWGTAVGGNLQTFWSDFLFIGGLYFIANMNNGFFFSCSSSIFV